MTTNERSRFLEHARKCMLVNAVIEESLRRFGGRLMPDKKEQLQNMPLTNLMSLVELVERARSGVEIQLLVISALAALEHSQTDHGNLRSSVSPY